MKLRERRISWYSVYLFGSYQQVALRHKPVIMASQTAFRCLQTGKHLKSDTDVIIISVYAAAFDFHNTVLFLNVCFMSIRMQQNNK